MVYLDKLERWVNFYNFLINDFHQFFCVCVCERKFFNFMLGTQANTALRDLSVNYKSKKCSSSNSEKLTGPRAKSRKFCLWELSTSTFEYLRCYHCWPGFRGGRDGLRNPNSPLTHRVSGPDTYISQITPETSSCITHGVSQTVEKGTMLSG